LLNRRTKQFTPVPASKLLKDTSTPLGKYIIYSVVFCSLLAIFLDKLFVHLVGSEEIAIILTIGIILVLLSILLWRMKSIAGIIEKKRAERFNRRLKDKRSS